MVPYVEGYKDKWNKLLKHKLHIQKLRLDAKNKSAECQRLKHEIKVMYAQIKKEEQAFFDAIK